ncbi:MAG: hypothetical protein WC917_00485 [Bacilli bacterium]|jgi:hypothetical protein
MPRDLLENYNAPNQVNASAINQPRDLLENYAGPPAEQAASIPEATQTNIGSYIPSPLKDVGLGALQGIANTPANIYDLIVRAQKAVNQPGSIGEQYPISKVIPSPPRFNIAPNTFAAKLGDVAGGVLIPQLGAEKTVPAVAEMLPKIASYLAEKAPSIAAGAESVIPSAISSATVAAGDPGSNIPLNMAIGGIGGGAISSALSKIMPALLTSKISPINIIQQLKPAVEDLTNKAKNILLGGNDSKTIPQTLFDKAKNYFELQRGIVSNKYDTFLQQAENSNLPYNNDGIKQTIAKIQKGYADDLASMSPNNPSYGTLLNDMKAISSYTPREAPPGQNIIDTRSSLADAIMDHVSGKQPIKMPTDNYDENGQLLATYTDAERAKRLLTNDITDAFRNGNNRLGSALKDIRDSVHQSVSDSVAGSPVMTSSLKDIDKEYADLMQKYMGTTGNETPFNKLYHTKNPDVDTFMSQYIKPGIQGDKSTSINNLLNMLPDDESRKLAAAWWLKDAKTPGEVMKQYNKLGVSQQNILFGDSRGILDTLSALYKKHPAVFKEQLDINKPAGMLAQSGASIAAFASGHPMYGSLLAARPVGQAIAPALATQKNLDKFLNLELESGKKTGMAGNYLSAALPAFMSRLRNN